MQHRLPLTQSFDVLPSTQPVRRAGQGAHAPDDDTLSFLDESPDDDLELSTRLPWVILIVDDDQGVHEATALVLGEERIEGRPLSLIHAKSAAQARALLESQPRVDLILLDIVMETKDAGLRLARAIRDELALPAVKILVHTGQPGLAPEGVVRSSPGVDGYVTKAGLTRGALLYAIASLLSNTTGR